MMKEIKTLNVRGEWRVKAEIKFGIYYTVEQKRNRRGEKKARRKAQGKSATEWKSRSEVGK